jgi:hypothetical protein
VDAENGRRALGEPTARGHFLSTREEWLRGERRPLNGRSPGHGCGMKQARELASGANRREAESACGRNEARPWKPSQQWTRASDVVKRDGTLAGGPGAERLRAGAWTKEL